MIEKNIWILSNINNKNIKHTILEGHIDNFKSCFVLVLELPVDK